MGEAIASKAERLAAYNANIAAAEKDPLLSPETGKPLSKVNTMRFGVGFLAFGILWMSGLGILNMATTLGQMCGPVIMSTIVVALGYNFAFPVAIALAIIGCFFIMAIKKVR